MNDRKLTYRFAITSMDIHMRPETSGYIQLSKHERVVEETIRREKELGLIWIEVMIAKEEPYDQM